jgi:hypothetical protein
MVVRGDDLLARYDELPRDVHWFPLVHARALPGVDRDIVRLDHRRLDRPIYPLDPDMPSPDLMPQLGNR